MSSVVIFRARHVMIVMGPMVAFLGNASATLSDLVNEKAALSPEPCGLKKLSASAWIPCFAVARALARCLWEETHVRQNLSGPARVEATRLYR